MSAYAAPIEPQVKIQHNLGDISAVFAIAEGRVSGSVFSLNEGIFFPRNGGGFFVSEMSVLLLDINVAGDGSLIGGNINYGSTGMSFLVPEGIVDPEARASGNVMGDIIDFGFTDSVYEFLFKVTSCQFHPEILFSCNVNDIWAAVFRSENLPTRFDGAAFPGGESIVSGPGTVRVGVVSEVPVPVPGVLFASVAIAGAALSRRTRVRRARPEGLS